MQIEDVTSQLLESVEQQIVELYEEKGSKANVEALFRIRDAIINEIGIDKVSSKLDSIKVNLIDPLTANSIANSQLLVLLEIKADLQLLIDLIRERNYI
jgi:hypothetical protein